MQRLERPYLRNILVLLFVVGVTALVVPGRGYARVSLAVLHRHGLRRATTAAAATMASISGSSDLSDLSRRDLQALAKEKGVKANLASAEIIRLLSELQGAPVPSAAVTKPKATAPEVVAPKVAAPKVAAPKVIAVKIAAPKVAPKVVAQKAAAAPEVEGGVLWSNEDYGSEELETWWRALPGPLLTVGSKGVMDSHLRSLEDLLRGHDKVRVKFASDKLDGPTMARTFMDNSPSLGAGAELLVIKRREFLIHRNPNAPRNTWPKLVTPGPSVKNSKNICHGCGRVGHHRIECPNTHLPDFRATGIHPNAEKALGGVPQPAASKKAKAPKLSAPEKEQLTPRKKANPRRSPLPKR